jgi:hypothetical protein
MGLTETPMMMRYTCARTTIAALLALAAAGCTGAPRQRNVEMGPVDQGAGTLAAARKYLEGRWTLESFDVYPPGREPITLKGAGTLTYDEFGNMRMEIRADEKAADLLRAAGIDIRDGTISSDGRTVVDMPNKTLSYVLEGQNAIAKPVGPLAPGRARHWEVTQDTLVLTTKDDAGKPMSIGRWRRMP